MSAYHVSICAFHRFSELDEASKQWTGPISVSIYATDTETYLLQHHIDKSESLKGRQDISYHIVFARQEVRQLYFVTFGLFGKKYSFCAISVYIQVLCRSYVSCRQFIIVTQSLCGHLYWSCLNYRVKLENLYLLLRLFKSLTIHFNGDIEFRLVIMCIPFVRYSIQSNVIGCTLITHQEKCEIMPLLSPDSHNHYLF